MGAFLDKPPYELSKDDIVQLKKDTGFTTKQIERLFNRFQHLDKDDDGLIGREELEQIQEIVLNPIGSRIVDVFFPPDTHLINYRTFIRQFAVFRPMKNKTPTYAVNSRDAKLRFLFNLMDHNKDGKVCRDDIYNMLEAMMGAQAGKDQLQQITERVITEADDNDDGRVGFREFKKVTEDLNVGIEMSFVSFS